MSYRHRESDVSHPLATYLLLSDLDAASVADDSAVPDPLVLAAIALVVLGRTEDLFTEKTVALRLVSPVVHRLRLEDLSVGPVDDVLRRCKRDADPLEIASDLIIFIVQSRHSITNKCLTD